MLRNATGDSAMLYIKPLNCVVVSYAGLEVYINFRIMPFLLQNLMLGFSSIGDPQDLTDTQPVAA